MPEVEDVRTVKSGLYRDMVELCMLLDAAWREKRVDLIKEAVVKARSIAVLIRKEQ